MGLSPRVRGSLEDVRRRDRIPGIIPACAGKPTSLQGSQALDEDYPRVCGEAGSNTVETASWEGLSPRVRGSPVAVGNLIQHRGIIPACAGKPSRKC